MGKYQGRFSNLHPSFKILLSFAILIMSFSLVGFIGGVISLIFSDVESLVNMTDENIPMLKAIQTLYSIGLFIIPSFASAYLIEETGIASLNLKKNITSKNIILSISLILVALPIATVSGIWNAQMNFPEFMNGIENWMRAKEDLAADMTQKFLAMDNIGSFLVNIFMIAIIPALGEELLFRGLLQNNIQKWTKNAHWAIFISAFTFSAVHMQFFGFIPRLMLGIFFGYLFWYTKNLWYPIIAHFVNNGLAVVVAFISPESEINKDPSEMELSTGLIIVAFISAALVVILLRKIKNSNSISQADI
ncbi:MAG: CPBP family intramembrane metalloprotease [Marinifilaceae bacterium]|jgi:membrane protease YdiL (CAAX protease family)|nr:CPBP family intramembrane metalloprotease [Marinifilaceae bacterium]